MMPLTVYFISIIMLVAWCPVCINLIFVNNLFSFRERGKEEEKWRNTDMRKKHQWLPLTCAPAWAKQ